MEIKKFKVELCQRGEIRDFVEKWHYSKNINGLMSEYCFKLTHEGEIIGAMIYGKIAMAGVWKKYTDSPDSLIELRRLCCIDDTPKNTESFFIGKTLRFLKKNTKIKRVLSYSDLTYNHTGVIYKASNFKLIGVTKPGKVIIHEKKRYHDKTIRTTYNGKLKPFAQKIKDALVDGTAFYQNTLSKNIYLYDLSY